MQIQQLGQINYATVQMYNFAHMWVERTRLSTLKRYEQFSAFSLQWQPIFLWRWPTDVLINLFYFIIIAFKIQQTIIARLSMTFLRKCAQKGCSWTTPHRRPDHHQTVPLMSLLFFGKYRFYCKTINKNHSNVIRFTHLYFKWRMHPSNQARNSPLGRHCSKRIRFPFVEKQLLP